MAIRQRFLGPPVPAGGHIPVDPPPGWRGNNQGGGSHPGGFGQWGGPGIHPILQTLISHLTGSAAATPNATFQPQNYQNQQTGEYGDTTAGNQIGSYLAGAQAGTDAGNIGGTGGLAGGAGHAGNPWGIAGYTLDPQWAGTPYGQLPLSAVSPSNLLRHGMYGAPGDDPLVAATALRNAVRQARGNMTPWSPPAGYTMSGPNQSWFQPGVMGHPVPPPT